MCTHQYLRGKKKKSDYVNLDVLSSRSLNKKKVNIYLKLLMPSLSKEQKVQILTAHSESSPLYSVTFLQLTKAIRYPVCCKAKTDLNSTLISSHSLLERT